MASSMLARNAIRRLSLKQSASLRCSSSRVAAPAVASSIVFDSESQQHQSWSAVLALAATIALTSALGATNNNALAEAAEEANDDEDSTNILNWSGTHSVELAPGTYHEPESVDELVQLVSNAYKTGQHIRPVGSALSPNGIAFDSRGMVSLSNLDKIIKVYRVIVLGTFDPIVIL